MIKFQSDKPHALILFIHIHMFIMNSNFLQYGKGVLHILGTILYCFYCHLPTVTYQLVMEVNRE